MPVHSQNPHGTTVYAPPVTCRAASPASSIGTQYDDDATSDHELVMSTLEFERSCDEKIGLWEPRPEETAAERDVLVTDPARGQGGAEEQVLFERIVQNLRDEIRRLDDEEIYERAVFKGSQIGLEVQPPTSDIDKIMRSMMGGGLDLSTFVPISDPVTGEVQTQPVEATLPGPWNSYGKKPTSLPRHVFPNRAPSLSPLSPANSSAFAPASSVASAQTATTITSPADELVGENNGAPARPKRTAAAGSRSRQTSATSNTVVGGKRTRSGQTRK